MLNEWHEVPTKPAARCASAEERASASEVRGARILAHERKRMQAVASRRSVRRYGVAMQRCSVCCAKAEG